jgi:cytosine deaminase
MCAAAASHFRVARVVFGAYDPKGGGIEHGPRLYAQPGCLHRPEAVGGVRERESALLLRKFFGGLRG